MDCTITDENTADNVKATVTNTQNEVKTERVLACGSECLDYRDVIITERVFSPFLGNKIKMLFSAIDL